MNKMSTILLERDIACCGAAANAGLDKEEKIIPWAAVIRLQVSSVSINYMNPWKTEHARQWTGSGFHIGNNQILTNHHVITGATSIRVERNGIPGNFAAIVISKSELCDLALITVHDDSFWNYLPAVDLAPEDAVPRLGDSVLALGYPLDAHTATVTRGIVSSIEMKDLTLKGYNPLQLHCVIDASINSGNSGGPVIDEKSGFVVGVAFAGSRNAQGRNFIISMPVVRMFLAAYAFDKRRDFGLLPETGFQAESLVNLSQRRKFLKDEKLVQTRLGCLVNHVNKFSCAYGIVKPGDVLMAVDGHAVSEKGEVVFRNLEMLPYTYAINNKLCGSPLTVSVVRRKNDGVVEELNLNLVLAPFKPLVPRITGCDYFPKWVIIGGLVFVNYGRPLLEYLSVQSANDELVNRLYDLLVAHERKEEDKELIVLVDVLAHDVNITYSRYVGKALATFNGNPIRNIKELALTYNSFKYLVSSSSSSSSSSAFSQQEQQQPDNFIDLAFVSSYPSTTIAAADADADADADATTANGNGSANTNNATATGELASTATSSRAVAAETVSKTTTIITVMIPRFAVVLEADKIALAEQDILTMNKVSSWCSQDLLE